MPLARRSLVSVSSIIVSVMLAGCTGRPRSEPAVQSERAPTAPTPPAPSLPTIAPAQGVAPDASMASPTSVRLTTVETTSFEAPMKLHTLDEAALVSRGRSVAELGGRSHPLVWSEIPWSEAPPPDAWYGGGQVDSIGGSWPDHTFAMLSDVRPRVAALRHAARWNAKRWVEWDRRPATGGLFIAIVPWAGGVLALQHLDMWSRSEEPPAAEIIALGQPTPASFTVPDGMRPVSLWASATGDVYAVAARSEDETSSSFATFDGPAYVLRWPVGGRGAHASYELPALEGLRPQANDVRMLFALDGVVHVGGGVGDERAEQWTSYLAREDGDGWSLASRPTQMKGMLATVAAAPDGSSFFTTAEQMGPLNARWVAGRGDGPNPGSLWQRLPDSHWREVTVEYDRIPGGRSKTFAPQAVAVVQDALWIVAGMAGDEAVGQGEVANLLGHAAMPR